MSGVSGMSPRLVNGLVSPVVAVGWRVHAKIAAEPVEEGAEMQCGSKDDILALGLGSNDRNDRNDRPRAPGAVGEQGLLRL